MRTRLGQRAAARRAVTNLRVSAAPGCGSRSPAGCGTGGWWWVVAGGGRWCRRPTGGGDEHEAGEGRVPWLGIDAAVDNRQSLTVSYTEPWFAPDAETARLVEAEARREIAPGHELHGLWVGRHGAVFRVR
jgi:hypothetical protein